VATRSQVMPSRLNATAFLSITLLKSSVIYCLSLEDFFKSEFEGGIYEYLTDPRCLDKRERVLQKCETFWTNLVQEHQVNPLGSEFKFLIRLGLVPLSPNMTI
jgi:hypothetical protein